MSKQTVTRAIGGKAVDVEIEHKTKTGGLPLGVGDSINHRPNEVERARKAFYEDFIASYEADLEGEPIEEFEEKILSNSFDNDDIEFYDEQL